jgi:hypothetical protein
MNTWFALAVSLGVLSVAVMGSAAQEANLSTVKHVPTEKPNAHYASNRAPLAVSPLVKLPIGAITPQGWLRTQLELEAEGYSGRLTEISGFCKADGNAWLSPDGTGHSPWEELPYWLKGFGDLGYVLRHERVTAEARKWLEGMLASQQADGWFGPAANRTRLGGRPDFWPNMVALNALQSFHEATSDQRVLDLMTKYFRFQLAVPEAQFLVPDWQKVRAGDNLESVYWLYNRTGEAWLLDLAAKIHKHTDPWADRVANYHGVNFAQCFRQPALYWMQAKEDRFRDAAYRNYDALYAEFGQVPGGLYGADENCRKGYGDPRQGAESCTVVEMAHSCQMLTKVTGDPLWADRGEDVAFNSLPCSMTPDLKGLHYLTAPNQAVLDRKNHAPGIQNGGDMLSYNPHSYRCCQHNVAHGWPYYAEELWLATADNGLCASLYAACEVQAKVGDGTTVKIAEATDYPFAEAVTLSFAAPKPVRFPLYLRIPGWCEAAKVALNGAALDAKAEPRSYLVIEREWKDGDRLELSLPMRLSVRVWTKNQNAVSVDRGPLTYSLKIGEEWKPYGKAPWPGHEVFPTTPWNYGLTVDPQNPAASLQVAVKPGPLAAQPFTPDAAPIELKAKARKIPEWQLDRHGLVAVLQPSPVHTTEPVETVTLIPMGCTRLRIAAFPVASDSPDANPWAAPPQAAHQATASHCFDGDTVDAMCDGLLPKNSNDHAIPRMTWWDHRGTAEWVAYRFPAPRTLSWADVYWFDDTGVGQCRIPASWKLLAKEADAWREVKLTGGSAYGTAKDAFNKVTFEPMTTQELRLEVQLQADVSGGILEWRVGAEPANK